MAYNIRLYGQLAEMAGAPYLEIAEAADVLALRGHLEALLPGLKQLPYLVAVDKHIVTGNRLLSPDAVIAILPPYSGG